MKHLEKHPTPVDGCFGCKAMTISFGTVPGGAKDKRNQVSAFNQREKDLHRYREKRRAGEQPDGTTRAAMEKSEKKADLFERRESDIVDNNPPEQVGKIKKAMLNRE